MLHGFPSQRRDQRMHVIPFLRKNHHENSDKKFFSTGESCVKKDCVPTIGSVRCQVIGVGRSERHLNPRSCSGAGHRL